MNWNTRPRPYQRGQRTFRLSANKLAEVGFCATLQSIARDDRAESFSLIRPRCRLEKTVFYTPTKVWYALGMSLTNLWATVLEAMGLRDAIILGVIAVPIAVAEYVGWFEKLSEISFVRAFLSSPLATKCEPLFHALYVGLIVVFIFVLLYATKMRLQDQPKLVFDLTLVKTVDESLGPHFQRPVYIGVRNISDVTVENVEVSLKNYIFDGTPSELGFNASKLLPPMLENANGSGNKVTIHPEQTKYFQLGEEGLDNDNVYYFKYQPLRHMGNDIITLQASGANVPPVLAKFYTGYNVEKPTPVDVSKGFAYDIYRSKAITIKPVEGYEDRVWVAPNKSEK